MFSLMYAQLSELSSLIDYVIFKNLLLVLDQSGGKVSASL